MQMICVCNENSDMVFAVLPRKMSDKKELAYLRLDKIIGKEKHWILDERETIKIPKGISRSVFIHDQGVAFQTLCRGAYGIGYQVHKQDALDDAG